MCGIKRIMLIFLLLLSIIIVGCVRDKELGEHEKERNAIKQKEIKYSENLIKSYMESFMQGNNNPEKYIEKSESKKMLSTKSELKPISYKIQNVSKVGSNINVDVDVVLCKVENPYFSLEKLTYIIREKENINEMKISDVVEVSTLEFSKEIENGEIIFKKRQGKVMEKTPILKAIDIPQYFLVKTSYEADKKVKVDNKNFGALGAAADGSQIIITSLENGNTTLMMVEKALEVFNNNTLIAEKSGGAGSINNVEQDSRAKPKVECIDFFENTAIEYIVFAPDGESVFVKSNSKGKGGISIYSPYSKNILSPKIMKKFNSSEYNVINGYFNNDDAIVLQVKNLKDNKIESYILYPKTDNFVKQDQ